MSDDGIIARFREHQGFLMLMAALEGKPALDLIQSNPCLAFCLAMNQAFHNPPVPSPMRAAGELMRRRQREILAWLGFPETEAFVRIMRKVAPESVTVNSCLQLRQAAFGTEELRMLSHLPRINAGVLALVSQSRFRPSLTPGLLSEVAGASAEDVREDSVRKLDDVYQMAGLLGRDPGAIRVQSRRRLDAIHDSLVCEINEREIPGYRGHDLPSPPLQGLRRERIRIAPIRCTGQLTQLGREQHNCVASYASRIREKRVFIYRVQVPWEVCTLSIRKNAREVWEIDDLRSACNGQPRLETRRLVCAWLSETQTPKGTTDLPGAVASPPVPILSINGIEITPWNDPGAWDAIACLRGDEFSRKSRPPRSGEWRAYKVTDHGEELVLITARKKNTRWRVQALWARSGSRTPGTTLAFVADWLDRSQPATAG